MTTLPLCELPAGAAARVLSVLVGGPLQQRLAELGLIEQTTVECLLRRPGLAAYLIRGAVIAIRNTDCADVLVEVLP